MPYTAAEALVIVDNPNADGRVTVWGWGYDWMCRRSSDGQAVCDRMEKTRWNLGTGFAYVPELNCIVPIGQAGSGYGDSSRWTVIAGSWANSPASGYLSEVYMHRYDPNDGADPAIIESVFSVTRAVDADIWLMPGGGGEAATGRAVLAAPGPAGTWYEFTVAFSDYGGGSAVKPSLLVYVYKEGGGGEALVAGWDFERMIGGANKGSAPIHVHMSVEPVAGRAMWNISINNSPIFGYLLPVGYWDANGHWQNISLGSGKVRFGVSGMPAMALVAPVTYPTSRELTPDKYVAIPDYIEETPNYTTLVVYDGDGQATATLDGTGRFGRPKVTFSSASGTGRAALFRVQEYRTATIGDASSSPVSSSGRDTFRVMSLRGRLTSQWRGAEIEAVVEALPEMNPDVFKRNAKIEADVRLDDGDSWTLMFTGYITHIEREQEGGRMGTIVRLRASDGIDARLRHKLMVGYPSFDYWEVDAAFKYILNRCGIPDSMIEIDSDITNGTLGDFRNLPWWGYREPVLEFDPATSVVSAIDKMCELRDLEWGVGADGKYFLRPRQTHTAGYYDFEIDEADLDDDDQLEVFTVEKPTDDIFNVLMVQSGWGAQANAKTYMDTDSMSNSSAINYIGDDWWRFEREAGGDDIGKLAGKVWNERLSSSRRVRWHTQYYPAIAPGAYVKFTISDMDVPSGSIFKIYSKQWQLEGLRFSQTLEGVLVEEGS